MNDELLLTVAELPRFSKDADDLLTAEERVMVVYHLANNPECGVVIPGGNGLRKVRFGAKGKGKSGGVRIIYYFHNEEIPLFLLAIYAKSNRANLSKSQVADFGKLITDILKKKGLK